jgi:hypothetical protein
MQSEKMQAAATKLAKTLADSGKIIEGGWAGFRLMVIPKDAGEVQVDEMRMAFFAGAQHLFSSIMTVMDSDREPTESDLRRMSLIHSELESFGKDFELRHLPIDGTA